MLLAEAERAYVLLRRLGLEEVAYERGWYSGGRYQPGWKIVGYAMIGGARTRIAMTSASDVAVFANAYEGRFDHAVRPGQKFSAEFHGGRVPEDEDGAGPGD